MGITFCFIFSGFWQICNYQCPHYSIIQNNFTVLKIHCSTLPFFNVCQPPTILLSLYLYTFFYRMLHTWNHLYVTFSHWLLSRCSVHLRFLCGSFCLFVFVFFGLIAHFITEKYSTLCIYHRIFPFIYWKQSWLPASYGNPELSLYKHLRAGFVWMGVSSCFG